MTPRDEKRCGVWLEVPESWDSNEWLEQIRRALRADSFSYTADSARLISLDDALVERVARAMHLAAHSSSVDDWREHGNGVMQCYRLLSKAAISDLLGGE